MIINHICLVLFNIAYYMANHWIAFLPPLKKNVKQNFFLSTFFKSIKLILKEIVKEP